MSFNIGIGLAVDGEKEFKTAVREINSELKLLDSQSKLIEAQYASNANSIEALTAKHEVLVKQLDAEEKKVKLNREQLENWQGVSQRAEARVEELKQRLADAQTEMERMKNTSGSTSEELEKQQKTIDDLNNQLKNAERAYVDSEDKVTRYQISLNRAETDLVKLDSRLQENEKSLDGAEKASDELTDAVEEYGNKVSDAQGKTSAFGDVLKANLISETIIRGVEKIAEGIEKIASSTVSTGASFERSMSQVSATMGITVEEINNGSSAYDTLKTAAEASGKSTKYTASQAAEALNYLALAGYDAQKAAATLPAVLNVAAAGGIDLAYASDLVTDAMGSLGMETSELNKYIDEMAKTSQKSNTSVAELGEATLVTAGMVSLTGQSLETMNAELGVLANNGIKGAEGGTHLRNILQRLVAPTRAGEEALKGLNVAVTDNEGNVRDLNDIMMDLNNSLSGMSDSGKTNFITTIFKQTDIAAVNALLKGTGDEFDNLYNELLNCEGAAADMAKTMEANLTGKVTILKSALEGLAITAYDKIKGTLSNSVDEATKSVGRLQDSMDKGKLGDSMDDFAEALDDVSEGVIDFAEDALPIAIEGLTWLLENADIVAAGVAGITAASMEMNVVAPAMEACIAAWKSYKEGADIATVAQKLFNTEVALNPLGLLATLLTGVTVGLISYAAFFDDANNETKEMIENNQKLIDSFASEKEKINQSTAEHENQISTITRLKDRISELNSKEQLSVKEKQEMLVITEELNQVLPDLNLTIDEQTGKLAENTEGWESNAEAQLEALEMQFRQEDAAEIARQRYEAESQLNEMVEQRAETEKKLAEITQEYDEFLKNNTLSGVDAVAVSEDYERCITELTNALGEQKGQEEELGGTIDSLTAKYTELVGASEEVENATRGVKNAVEETDNVTVTYAGNTYEVSEQVAANIELIGEAYAEAKTEAEDSINTQVGLFQELNTESDLTASQMAENLKTQTEAFTQYSDNLILASELMKTDTTGNFTEIVTAIEAMGMSGAGYLDELLTAYQDGSESFNEILSEWGSMTEAKQTLTDTMADFETGYSESMDAILGVQTEHTTSMKNDIEGKLTDTLESVKKKDADTVTEVTATLETLTSTIETEGEKVKDAAVGVASDTLGETEKDLGINGGISSEFVEIGYAIPSGLAAGILKGKEEAVAAAVEVAEATYIASKSTLEVNSPSRKYEWLGEQCQEGLALGYINNMDSAKRRISAATDELLDYDADVASLGIFMDRVNTRYAGVEQNSELNGNVQKMLELFEAYMPVIAASSNKQIVLNNGVLVGELSPDIDHEIGGIGNRKERGNCG